MPATADVLEVGMEMSRVVITGLGVVAPNGIGKQEFWESILEGKSGISRISRFDVSDLPTQIAGEIKEFSFDGHPDLSDHQQMGLQSKFGLLAAKLALEDARLKPESEDLNIGSIIGTSNPTYDLIEQEVERLSRGADYRSIDPRILSSVDPFSTSAMVSYQLHIRGISRAIVTSCTSGLNAIGQAFSEVAQGRYDVIVAGSTDSALSRYAFMSFCAAGIMSKRNDKPGQASRPFDALRDGGVLSEGAGVVVLESLDHAMARGAPVYAEVVGYAECAMGVDHRMIRSSMAASMKLALQDAFLSPQQVDYICAHGPSDPITDRVETEAIKLIFQEHAYRIPVSSIKAITGNCQSASGPMQVIATCLAIREEIVPPTWNYEYPDPNCDLDYVPNEPRRNQIHFALLNSHGFNGTDATIVLGKFQP